MGLFNLFKTNNNGSLYRGGDGASIETAIVIDTTNSMIGVPAEYKYIIGKYGQKDVGWILESQAVMENNGRNYDRINIKLNNGELKKYYFDITLFYDKF